MAVFTDEFLVRLQEGDATAGENLIQFLSMHSISELTRLLQATEVALEQKYSEIVFEKSGPPVFSQAQSWLRSQCGRTLAEDDKKLVVTILGWLRRRCRFKTVLNAEGDRMECSVAIVRDPRRPLALFCMTSSSASSKKLLVRAELPDALSLLDGSAEI